MTLEMTQRPRVLERLQDFSKVGRAQKENLSVPTLGPVG